VGYFPCRPARNNRESSRAVSRARLVNAMQRWVAPSVHDGDRWTPRRPIKLAIAASARGVAA